MNDDVQLLNVLIIAIVFFFGFAGFYTWPPLKVKLKDTKVFGGKPDD